MMINNISNTLNRVFGSIGNCIAQFARSFAISQIARDILTNLFGVSHPSPVTISKKVVNKPLQMLLFTQEIDYRDEKMPEEGSSPLLREKSLPRPDQPTLGTRRASFDAETTMDDTVPLYENYFTEGQLSPTVETSTRQEEDPLDRLSSSPNHMDGTENPIEETFGASSCEVIETDNFGNPKS